MRLTIVNNLLRARDQATISFSIFIWVSFVSSLCSAQGQHSPLWGNLEKGEFDIGFQVSYEFDHSRIFHGPQPITGKKFPGETARPVRIELWYPSASNMAGKKMKYKDYINLQPADKRFLDYNQPIVDYDNWASVNWTNQKDSSIQKLLNLGTEAIRNAKPAMGKFPLVLHFLGLNNRRNENIPLWEWLASHGYVVMSIPQISGGSDVFLELGLGSILSRETQVRDMEFALSTIQKMNFIDFDNMAAIGYSYGSVFAMRMAMLNPNIKAIATFDGNLNNKNGQNVIESFFNPKIKVSWLNVYRNSYENVDLKIFETLKYTNRYRVTYTHANHGDFEDFAMATWLMKQQTPPYALKERSPEDAVRNYETTCKLTLEFFNKHIKNIPRASDSFDRLISKGRSEGTIADYEFKKASKVIDEEDLAHIIIYYGLDEAEKLYQMAKSDSTYEVLISPSDLMIVATSLRMGGRRVNKSNDILFFMEKHFPPDKKVFLEISKNFLELGDVPKARKYLTKVLEVDNENEEAKRLEQLLNSR